MTVLDQAFIKAYVERGVVRKAKGAKRAPPALSATEAPAIAAPEAEAARTTVCDETQAAAEAAPVKASPAKACPVATASEDAAPPGSAPVKPASVERFMAALDRPLQTARPARQQRRPATVAHDDPPGLTVGRTWEPSVPLAHARADRAELTGIEVLPFNAAALLDAPVVAASEPVPAQQVTSDAIVGWVERSEPHQESAEPAATEAPVVASWQPALQMDRFFWPQICTQLNALADEALKTLAEALATAANEGRKVVALAGCSPNSGSTTLVLAAGRALARCGLRVLLADAVRSKGQLAHRLGWIPTATWEDVWDGHAPLQEAVVESVADRLAVLPRAETTTTSHAPPRDDAHIAADLKFLGQQYDLVLVDLGPLDDSMPSDGFAQGLGSSLDAIVLVHNVRSTTPNRLAELERWLSSAGVSPLGVIQNFVRG